MDINTLGLMNGSFYQSLISITSPEVIMIIAAVLLTSTLPLGVIKIKKPENINGIEPIASE